MYACNFTLAQLYCKHVVMKRHNRRQQSRHREKQRYVIRKTAEFVIQKKACVLVALHEPRHQGPEQGGGHNEGMQGPSSSQLQASTRRYSCKP